MSTISIATTHNVSLEFEAASITSRMLATLLDYALVIGGIVVWLLIVAEIGVKGELILQAISILVFVLIVFAPFLQETFLDGQTFGKRLLNIRVMSLDGSAPTAGAYFTRWLTGLLEVFATFGAVAAVSYSVTRNHQRLGDVVAGTVVVVVPKPVTLSSLRVEAYADKTVMFPNVRILTDADIQIIREVLLVYRTGVDVSTSMKLIERAAVAVDLKLRTPHKLAPQEYLVRVLADHTAVHS